MLPLSVDTFLSTHQDLLWLLTVAIDLSLTLLLYRFFGKMGLYTIVILNIMLSNFQGPKLTVIFGMETSLGVILYSGIYFATDLLSEKYGKREGQRAVLLGFVASMILVIMIYISLLFLPSNVPEHVDFAKQVHVAIETIFNFTPLFVFGSLLAYLITQSFDVWIFHYLKEKTQGRHLWLRNNASTISSQALDTLLYAGIVWGPVVGFWAAIHLAFAKYIIKVIIAAIDTVFIYWARNWDVTDKDWNESPEQQFFNNDKVSPNNEDKTTL
jgi:queuosine precursor transporter